MNEHAAPDLTRPDGMGFQPGLALDAVIFGFHQNQLKIMLLAYRNTGTLALPGGFIWETEDVNQAARRMLSERTGLEAIYLEQFYTFGDRARHDPAPLRAIMVENGVRPTENHWLLRRFVTVGYYALVDFTRAVPRSDTLSDSCAWYDLATLPPLMLDHRAILEKALDTLRANLDRRVVGYNLLPETFTMADLQRLYETILGHPLNRSSFQRRMLNGGMLERIEKKYSGGAHKAPYLYRFVTSG